jgi:hypothetical protein
MQTGMLRGVLLSLGLLGALAAVSCNSPQQARAALAPAPLQQNDTDRTQETGVPPRSMFAGSWQAQEVTFRNYPEAQKTAFQNAEQALQSMKEQIFIKFNEDGRMRTSLEAVMGEAGQPYTGHWRIAENGREIILRTQEGQAAHHFFLRELTKEEMILVQVSDEQELETLWVFRRKH